MRTIETQTKLMVDVTVVADGMYIALIIDGEGYTLTFDDAARIAEALRETALTVRKVVKP